MTYCTSFARCNTIYRIKILVTTRAGNQSSSVARNALWRFQASDMDRVKLSAKFRLLIRITRRRISDLGYRSGHLRIYAFPFPDTILRWITI